jgi:hypothetical protein
VWLLGFWKKIVERKVVYFFRRCRLDCAEAERRIAKLKEDNKEYVPKTEYLALQQTHDELVKTSEQLKQNFRNAKVEYKYIDLKE